MSINIQAGIWSITVPLSEKGIEVAKQFLDLLKEELEETKE